MFTAMSYEPGAMSYFRQLLVAMVVLGIAGGVIAGIAEADTYYIAPDGNDDWSGTIVQPWKTLYKACQTLVAGDTVYLRAGTHYVSRSNIPLNSGSAGNPITFAAYSGEVAILRPTVDYAYVGFTLQDHSYITIDGLEISHCLLGIYIKLGHKVDHIIVKNCHIHDSERSPGNCAAIYAGSGASTYCSTHCQFLNNILHDNRGPSTNAAGIELYDMANTTIRGNIIYNQTGVGIFLKYRNSNCDVSQNIIYDSHYAIWSSGASDNCDLHENIIYDCECGFRLWDSMGTKVYNNVMENCGVGIRIYDGARDQIIYNNIIYGISGYSQGIGRWYGSDGTIAYMAYNNVYNCVEAYHDVEEGENSIQVDPEFVNPATHDYHLQSSSPCKGTGRYGEDMGAYPLGSGPDTTPPSRSNPQPTGTLSSRTTSTSISLDTDETATCKYGTLTSVPYDGIAETFSNTNSTSHFQTITGLSDGETRTYYIRCQDEQGNANTDDFTISFSVGLFPQGDVTGDDSVDITDVQACVNHILDLQDWGSAADVNEDSAVNVLDVQAIVNIVLSG